MKGKKTAVIVYLVLLVASELTQRVWVERDPSEPEAAWNQEAVGPRALLLHGALGSPQDFETLQAELSKLGSRRLYAPDLRGDSDWLEARTRAWFERSNIPQGEGIHLVGYGYGAVDVLALADRYPERVESVTLLSGAVSPSYELLGNASLNRALKGFQRAVLWLVENGVPHFGLASELPINESYATRVFEADLGQSERAYESLRAPLLLVGASQDPLVTERTLAAYQAVRPESELAFHPGQARGLLKENASAVAQDLFRHWRASEREENDVQHESGTRFSELEGVRLNAWLAGALLAVATFVSEDFACIGGGLLAYAGAVSLWVAVGGCLFGIFVGDLFIYLIGRSLGASALELPVLRRLASPQKVSRCAHWFEKRGVALVVLTRFLPGSRVPTYFTAGVVKVGFFRFAVALLIASAVWTPILVILSYFLGERFLHFFEGIGGAAWIGILIAVLAFVVTTRILGKLMTWRGRRLLFSRWQRFRRWEFWPIWALYPPVALYILWLMLKHRSLTLPASVNPCMPASGLVYESKSQILEHLQKFGVPVARFAVIPFGGSLAEKRQRLDVFMEEQGLDYPIVLKPDIGQRGAGVSIVATPEAAETFFRDQVEDTIAQEYVSGVEYGVLYHRFIDEERGTVSSVTDKRMVSVVGDGVSPLEELVLRDERAVCMARFFLNEFEEKLEDVLPGGQRFWLSALGTHCRGALFLDGAGLITTELQSAIDGFSRRVDGFHFGRYDLRVPTEEDLKNGQGIKVLELNGLTSEPTHMYDPKHSVFFAWAALMRQWRLIFELAQKNRLSGHEPVSLKFILRLVAGHLRGVPSRDLS